MTKHQEYEYFLGDTRYETEEALHEAEAKTCLTANMTEEIIYLWQILM